MKKMTSKTSNYIEKEYTTALNDLLTLSQE